MNHKETNSTPHAFVLQNWSNFNQTTLNSSKKKLEFAKLEKFTSDFTGVGKLTHCPRRKPTTTLAEQFSPASNPPPTDPPNAAPYRTTPPVLVVAQPATGRRPPPSLARWPVDPHSPENIPQFITSPSCTTTAKINRCFQLP